MISHFDEFGRCIPGKLSSDVHQKVRRYFRIANQSITPGDIFANTKNVWGDKIHLDENEFRSRVDSILQKINADTSVQKILKGVYVPFLIPATGKITDLAVTFENEWVPNIKKSFEASDPKHTMTNHCTHEFAGTMKLRPGSRHETLIAKAEKEDVVGVYFPCLSEFSIAACIERLDQLPKEFILSGALDTSAALIGNPSLLINKESYAPLLWLSAYTGPDDLTYHFEPYGYNMTLNRRPHFNKAAEYWWNGLTVLSE